MPKSPEQEMYSEEKALKEASELKAKVESGEAKDYTEAERSIDKLRKDWKYLSSEVLKLRDCQEKDFFKSLPTKKRDYRKILEEWQHAEDVSGGHDYIKSLEGGEYGTEEGLYTIEDLEIKDKTIVALVEKSSGKDKNDQTRSIIISAFREGKEIKTDEIQQSAFGVRDYTTINDLEVKNNEVLAEIMTEDILFHHSEDAPVDEIEKPIYEFKFILDEDKVVSKKKNKATFLDNDGKIREKEKFYYEK